MAPLLQADCDVIKIDIQCLVQGDVVLECVHFDLDPEKEVMMFRIMFNTAFIRSNILILNSENLDILWDSKERYPKGFRAEVSMSLSLLLKSAEKNCTHLVFLASGFIYYFLDTQKHKTSIRFYLFFPLHAMQISI